MYIVYTVGWNDFFIICSYDEACLVLRERPAFLAFEGHKGRKAKKGQKIFFCQMSQNGLKWREMQKKIFPVITFLAFVRFGHKGQWPFDSPKLIFMMKDTLY